MANQSLGGRLSDSNLTWPNSDRIMKTTIMRTTICLLIWLLPALCFGQEELNDNREILKRPETSGAMAEIVYRRLTVVHEQMGEDKLEDAIKGLTKLEGQNLSRYEKALVQQTFGFIYHPSPGRRLELQLHWVLF